MAVQRFRVCESLKLKSKQSSYIQSKAASCRDVLHRTCILGQICITSV